MVCEDFNNKVGISAKRELMVDLAEKRPWW